MFPLPAEIQLRSDSKAGSFRYTILVLQTAFLSQDLCKLTYSGLIAGSTENNNKKEVIFGGKLSTRGTAIKEIKVK